MPASRIGCGLTKSGSPMPSEMTSFIVATISKNLRMPEGGTLFTRVATKLSPASAVLLSAISSIAICFLLRTGLQHRFERDAPLVSDFLTGNLPLAEQAPYLLWLISKQL